MRATVIVCIFGLIFHAAAAQPTDSTRPADKIAVIDADSCLPGIAAAERQFALPPKLLQTIAIVESGRANPASGRVAPWPWTINVAGIDHFFATKAAAIEAVQGLQKDGARSIDVGCMQINLMTYPDAFTSLDEAFDPSANTQYGARFLSALFHEIGNWPQAAAAYHSRTQEIGATYETRVMAIWPLAGQFPDPTLQQRGQPAALEPDTSAYTPEYAALLKQMWADHAHLTTMLGTIAPLAPRQTKPNEPDYSRYTPEFAAELKRTREDHARLAAMSGPVVRPVHQQAKFVVPERTRNTSDFAANQVRTSEAREFER